MVTSESCRDEGTFGIGNRDAQNERGTNLCSEAEINEPYFATVARPSFVFLFAVELREHLICRRFSSESLSDSWSTFFAASVTG